MPFSKLKTPKARFLGGLKLFLIETEKQIILFYTNRGKYLEKQRKVFFKRFIKNQEGSKAGMVEAACSTKYTKYCQELFD